MWAFTADRRGRFSGRSSGAWFGDQRSVVFLYRVGRMPFCGRDKFLVGTSK